MKARWCISLATLISMAMAARPGVCQDQPAVSLPSGVKAVWDLNKAYRETTPTRERLSINGLWQWQPAESKTDEVPTANWGYFKVPGSWPGVSDYMQKDSQTVFAHPSWKKKPLRDVSTAWYQREISVPQSWAGRRVILSTDYLNSEAVVYVDGKKVGEMLFPSGEVDLTSACPPGSKHQLTLRVTAMPLQAVMLAFNDTNSSRPTRGTVARRGLCGDVYLVGAPTGPRMDDLKVDTSVRNGEITFHAALKDLAPDAQYTLRATITDKGSAVKEITSKPFRAADLKDGRIVVTEKWKPEKLWDVHTPQNMYDVSASLVDNGKVLDTALPVRFGFREFWIDGRDFYLNGTRIFLSSVPIDNAQVGAALATYEAAKESMLRLQSLGINFVYTHNYGCEPGTHISFTEILKAADDVGMLISFSQPHCGQYDWKKPDADQNNGYAHHAEFYVRAAENHPSVVFYSMNHNSTGYTDDMNPDMIDGLSRPGSRGGQDNATRAQRAEAIVHRLDPSRIVYHHSSGNLSSMHTSNFYSNWAPVQEMSDWFEHWATKGVKPLFTCEYSVPCSWDWAMYRGWYHGKREFGSAPVPWEFCLAEWNSQFLGDAAFKISDAEKANLRWEGKQFREGKLWHRWDYPNDLGSRVFTERYPVFAMYLADNWRAFRTWGMSANSPWEHGAYWTLRKGVDKSRKELKVDWENLQRPGLSPDFLDQRYERVDMAFERTDWIPTVAAEAIYRNNMPLLAYIGGKGEQFTGKDHNFLAGETVEKQLIVINNCRQTVSCECSWSLGLPAKPAAGQKTLSVETGQQARVPLRFELPAGIAPGKYELAATFKFSNGQTQKDSFTVHVLPPAPAATRATKIALWDPKGETAKLLAGLGVKCQAIEANADLAGYDVLVIGKAALTLDGPAPNLAGVGKGLKVVVFEQTSEVLVQRLGFRVNEYGLRNVFKRTPDHPLLAGLDIENLRDWRGDATILPPRLKYTTNNNSFSGTPTVQWNGVPVTHVWRCGNRGSVASVLIEKPARGNFLPIVDGGFSLQYSPLMEYRSGRGMVLFCQMDVTGRTESDPAAARLAQNIVAYVSDWKPAASRQALYAGDPAGKKHLESAGVTLGSYEGGELSPGQVLVVGPGGGAQLSARAAAVAPWLKAGGNLLAIGLDQADVQSLLPKVTTKKAEHIAAYFEPFGATSLLAGVGPADVHNRDPREFSLISAGAAIFGDGVLAKAEGANVVFCQEVPWQFEYKQDQYNVKRTFRRASFLLNRLLANMGVEGSTPLLERFGRPVAAKETLRCLDGLYLDQPQEWDDPYRFFRW